MDRPSLAALLGDSLHIYTFIYNIFLILFLLFVDRLITCISFPNSFSTQSHLYIAYTLVRCMIRGVPDRGFQNPAGTGLSGQNYENPAGLSGRLSSHDVSSREPPKDRVVPLRSRPQDQTIGSNHKLRLVLVMLISSNSQIQGIFHSSF